MKIKRRHVEKNCVLFSTVKTARAHREANGMKNPAHNLLVNGGIDFQLAVLAENRNEIHTPLFGLPYRIVNYVNVVAVITRFSAGDTIVFGKDFNPFVISGTYAPYSSIFLELHLGGW